jgi:hypothetical protein
VTCEIHPFGTTQSCIFPCSSIEWALSVPRGIRSVDVLNDTSFRQTLAEDPLDGSGPITLQALATADLAGSVVVSRVLLLMRPRPTQTWRRSPCSTNIPPGSPDGGRPGGAAHS